MKHDPSAEPSDLVDTDVEAAVAGFGKFARWDRQHDHELKTLLEEGATYAEAAVAMNRTPAQVKRRAVYAGLRPGFRENRPRVHKEPPTAFGRWYSGENQQPDFHALREASVWHLVDLKRAGHSPTRVELDIGHDDYTVRHVPILGQSGSIYGSPSATCAGL